jgi:hypothetical protein
MGAQRLAPTWQARRASEASQIVPARLASGPCNSLRVIRRVRLAMVRVLSKGGGRNKGGLPGTAHPRARRKGMGSPKGMARLKVAMVRRRQWQPRPPVRRRRPA